MRSVDFIDDHRLGKIDARVRDQTLAFLVRQKVGNKIDTAAEILGGHEDGSFVQ
jgi:hypothetical protein